MAAEPVTSELFETYQNEYNTLTANVSRRINSQIPSLTGGAPSRRLALAARTRGAAPLTAAAHGRVHVRWHAPVAREEKGGHPHR